METPCNDMLIANILQQLATGQLDPSKGLCFGKDVTAMRNALQAWFTSDQHSSYTLKGGNSKQYSLGCYTDRPSKVPDDALLSTARCGVRIHACKRKDDTWYITYADTMHKNMCDSVARPSVNAVVRQLGTVILKITQKNISSTVVQELVRGEFGEVTMSRRTCLRIKQAVHLGSREHHDDNFHITESVVER
jgi:hypothetical protein